MVENIFRRLSQAEHARGSMSNRIFEAGREVLRPIVFAIGIIIIVYLPILSFEDIEGKMFRPMALTVVFALVGSLACALTLVPVMASLLIKQVSHGEPWLARKCDRAHAWLTAAIAPRPRIALAVAGIVLAVSFLFAPFLGTEFIPTLDEGSINLDVLRVPSISLDGAIADATRVEKVLMKEVPEVTTIVSRIGHSELATDPTGPDESDQYVFLKPHDEWRFKHRDDLVADIQRILEKEVPEDNFGFSQPIEEKLNDMIAGIKGNVAIHIYGDDFDKMMDMGAKIFAVVRALPGAADGKIAPRAGLPDLDIKVDRSAVARYGINVKDVLDAIETLGGKVVGQVVEGDARYLLQVRFAKEARSNREQIDDIKIAAPDGKLIPLAQLATFTSREGPVAIWRENLTRRVSVAINVRGTDLG